MATWIDDEGRLIEREDENYQLVLLPETNGEVWHVMDSWGMQLACRLIVLGYNLDVGEALNFGFKECPHGSTGNDRAYAIHTVMDRALTLAKSAVAIGRIKDPDTPANWLAWAKGKGYSVAHLEPDTAATSGAQENAAPPVPERESANTDGLVSWQAAILENLQSIIHAHGDAPNTWNVISWCKKHGPRDVFPDKQPNEREYLAWSDLGGVPHTITKGTVDNTLSLWRKAGKFPSRK